MVSKRNAKRRRRRRRIADLKRAAREFPSDDPTVEIWYAEYVAKGGKPVKRELPSDVGAILAVRGT